MTIEFIRSKILDPVPHGFFTRTGGVSTGIFAELNCGIRSGDKLEKVTKNRELAILSLGRRTNSLVTAIQTHSSDVIFLDAVPDESITCDGLVASNPEISLGVMSADCQPVLLADRTAGVVGAAHAGWRGALNGIIGKMIAKMIAHGARRDRIRASIGPSICRERYEVGPEFQGEFMRANPESKKFFSDSSGNRLHFDLQGFSLELLSLEGVDNAEWTGHCTYKDPQTFFSRRRSMHQNETEFGVMISIIGI